MSCPTYSYKEVGSGFAENDLEEFDEIAAGVAWTRTLKVLREAFAVKVDVEGIRDRHLESMLISSSMVVVVESVAPLTFDRFTEEP